MKLVPLGLTFSTSLSVTISSYWVHGGLCWEEICGHFQLHGRGWIDDWHLPGPDMLSVGIHACFLLHVCNMFFRNPQALTWTHFLTTVLLAFLLLLWKSYCHTIFIMVKYLGFHCDIPNKDFPFIYYYLKCNSYPMKSLI